MNILFRYNILMKKNFDEESFINYLIDINKNTNIREI